MIRIRGGGIEGVFDGARESRRCSVTAREVNKKIDFWYRIFICRRMKENEMREMKVIFRFLSF